MGMGKQKIKDGREWKKNVAKEGMLRREKQIEGRDARRSLKRGKDSRRRNKDLGRLRRKNRNGMVEEVCKGDVKTGGETRSKVKNKEEQGNEGRRMFQRGKGSRRE